jgi:phosphonate transport system permease protein
MSGSPLPLVFRDRRRLAWARAAAVLADSLVVAYLLWCVSFLVAHAADEMGRSGWLESRAGFVGQRPWLLLLAPLVAALWEVTGESVGQRLNRVRVVDGAGRRAGPDRRAWRGVLATLQTLVVLFPAALGVLREVQGLAGGFWFFLTLLLALAFLALAFVDPLGRGLPGRFSGTRTEFRPTRETVKRRPWWQRLNAWVGIVLLVLTFRVGFVLTEFHPSELVENVSDTFPVLSRLFHPDWSIVGAVVEKMVETIFLALMASALALPFAFGLSFLGARNVMTKTTVGRVVYVLARLFMNVTRSIEPLVWVIIFSLWVRVGPDAGMLALFIHSVAALGKLYSEAIESIDPGPVEAIQATGANALQVLRYGVVPQVVPPFLSFTVYRWDINVRMATILGLVGGGGIGDMLINYQRLGRYEPLGTILLFVTLVVWAMDWASSKARERLA